jgi:hypothetical protein
MSTDPKPPNWPISNKYQMAVQHPEMAFQDQELKIGQVTVQSNGLPMLSSGKYACVFKVTSGLRSYAVRCFLTEVKDQHRRYDMLSSHLKQFRLHSLVGFFYIPQGILVEGNWYPILKMDWDSGKPLDAFIGQNIHKPNVIKNLAANWRGVQAGLRGAYMAHGDLQHGNIQVATTGEITLVDYDCMYIPGFKGELSPERGHKNYQHPQRTDQYGEWLDNFSALVIYLSLLGLAADPSLWEKFYNEDNLILKEEDFRNPSQSPCFAQLKSSSDPVVRTLAIELEDCCRNDITQTPILEVLLQGIQQTSSRPAMVTVPQIEPLEIESQQSQTTLEGRVFCESCGKEIAGDTQWCENCGKGVNVSAQENIDTGTNQKKSHTLIWVLAVASIFLILIALLIWSGAFGHSPPVSATINSTSTTTTTGPVTITTQTYAAVTTTSTTISLIYFLMTPNSQFNLYVGDIKQYIAYGFYSDGTKRDLTNLVSWSISNANVAGMTSAFGAIIGKNPGTAYITVSYQGITSSPVWVTVLDNVTTTTTNIPTTYTTVSITTTSTTTGINTYSGGLSPYSACYDGTNIWIVNWTGNNITKMKDSDGSILGTFPVGTSPYSCCYDGANIWVANSKSNNITKLRASDGAILGTYSAGQNPMGCCFDGTNVWVLNGNNNSVTKIRASDGVMLGTFTVINTFGLICFDGTNIWVTNYNSDVVTKLKASDGTILGSYTVGTSPFGICCDGTNIWVTNYGSNTVTKLKASDGTLLGTYPVGIEPIGVCYDGANIWVANWTSHTVTKLRDIDGLVLGTYNVGTYPQGICSDGTNIWVTSYGSNNITKIPINQ